ncbi:hypothetical protein HDU96_006247 [Phlyctochytrium bullatum]|nr:hypothetical protein HDU96_006247 [Phlyctochytrium bullatum]
MFPTAHTHMFSPISIGAMATAHELMTNNNPSKKPYPAASPASEKGSATPASAGGYLKMEETLAPKPKKAPMVVKPFMNPFGKPGVI